MAALDSDLDYREAQRRVYDFVESPEEFWRSVSCSENKKPATTGESNCGQLESADCSADSPF